MSSFQKSCFPKNERPRERMALYGTEVLRDVELLALFLRTGRKGRNVLEVAEDLLKEWGSLRALARCSLEELSQISGIGGAKAAELKAAFEMGKRMMRPELEKVLLDSGEAIYHRMRVSLEHLAYETFWVLLLDTRYRLLEYKELFRGTLSETLAHPREIFQSAIAKRAYAIAVVHNHPSGDPLPSIADRRFTKRLFCAGELLKIPLMDHVIIGTEAGERKPYFSFREAGLL